MTAENEYQSPFESTPDDLETYSDLINQGMDPEKAHEFVIGHKLAQAAGISRFNELITQGHTPEEAAAKIHEFDAETDQHDLDAYNALVASGMSTEEAYAHLHSHAPEESDAHNRPEKESLIDKARLNTLIKQASIKGALIGHDKDIDLTAYDKGQFRLVIDVAGELLEPITSSPEWAKFIRLVEEAMAKGMAGFTAHEGTYVPTWCLDGGPDAHVRKILRPTDEGSLMGIEIPTGIYDAYDIDRAAAMLDTFTRSEATLRGAAARGLRDPLVKLGRFITKK